MARRLTGTNRNRDLERRLMPAMPVKRWHPRVRARAELGLRKTTFQGLIITGAAMREAAERRGRHGQMS